MTVLTVRETTDAPVVSTEAASQGNKSGKRWRARVIEAGQGSSAYYPESVLEDYASVFQPGTKVYFDHPGFSEEMDRPERSVRDLVGKLVTEGVYEDGAIYAEVEFYSWAAPIIEEMASDVGLSIRAIGTGEDGGNGPTLTSFVEVLSVDVVTVPGAGGGLIEMLESARVKTAEDYNATVNPTEENDMTKEIMEALNALPAQIVEALQNAVKESASAQSATEEKPAEEPKFDPIEVADALAESSLSKHGRKAVVAAVKGGVPLTEAIETQEKYETEIAESAKQEHYNVIEEGDRQDNLKVPGFKKVGA